MSSKMGFLPTFNKVLIRTETAPEQSTGGIYIPRTVREDHRTGEVLAVGPGTRDEDTGVWKPVEVKVGERVIFMPYVGQYIKINGEELMLLKEDELIAVIEND